MPFRKNLPPLVGETGRQKLIGRVIHSLLPVVG